MQLHGNARTCPNSRRLLVARVLEQGWSVTAAAEAAGVTERTVWRWLGRWRAEGEAGLLDRSSRPRRSPGQLPAATVEAITSLRKLRMTAAQIAEVLGLALSTVSAWLKRIGLGKRSRLEPPEPANRKALAELELRHLRIRPYRPRTNGKAERFIQTLINEWAYERVYGSSAERATCLPLFLDRYNFRRPHGSLGHQPPASRLTNLARNYT